MIATKSKKTSYTSAVSDRMVKHSESGTRLKCQLELVLILSLVSVGLATIFAANATSYPQTHEIAEFWDAENNFCWFKQETNVSCVPACVQMILRSYSVDPLPSQYELALEMKTDINHTTQWEFTYLPFVNRDFKEYHNASLSDNRDLALYSLKGYVSQDYRILVITWFSLTDKEAGNITHGRVITGYNETGIFFHDPLSGPNHYSHNSDFLELWSTRHGYWALVIKQVVPPKPSYLFIKWVKENLDIIALLIVGVVVEVHYVSRIANFTNSIALYLFFSRREIPSNLIGLVINGYVILGLLMGVIGLISYLADESLPNDYYTFNLIFYNSLTVGAIMLFANALL